MKDEKKAMNNLLKCLALVLTISAGAFADDSTKVITVTTSAQLDSLIQNNHAVLIDFSAEWCPPCKVLKPIMKELATDYEGEIIVATVDIDRSPEIQKEYGVSAVPSVVVFEDGENIGTIKGAAPRYIYYGLAMAFTGKVDEASLERR